MVPVPFEDSLELVKVFGIGHVCEENKTSNIYSWSLIIKPIKTPADVILLLCHCHCHRQQNHNKKYIYLYDKKGLFIPLQSRRDKQEVNTGHFFALHVSQWCANVTLHAQGIVYKAHSSNMKLKAVTVPLTSFYLCPPAESSSSFREWFNGK